MRRKMTETEKMVFEAKSKKILDNNKQVSADTQPRTWEDVRNANKDSRTVKLMDTLLESDEDKLKLVDIIAGLDSDTIKELWMILWRTSAHITWLEGKVASLMEGKDDEV